MKTIQSPLFQSVPHALAQKLQQLTMELPIDEIFIYKATPKDNGHLIIISANNKDIEVIETRKWLRNASKEHQMLLHVLSSQQMRYAHKNGNLFILGYCLPSAKVYQNIDCPSRSYTAWADFKKSYKYCENEYFYHHDVLMTLADEFHAMEARASVFITYLSILQHHFTYLENLYIGHSFHHKTLTERLNHLIQYLPEVESLFVKQNGESFFLLRQLEKAREGGDEINLHFELYSALCEVEKQLQSLVSDRFLKLKRRIKKQSKNNFSAVAPTKPLLETNLSLLVSHIIKMKQPEEIYCFHKTQSDATLCYFLLLIGDGLSTELLSRIQQSVANVFKGLFSVIIIGHSRIWIQKELFDHQLFFKNIMLDENRVYQSPKGPYNIHWEEPYTPSYPDLDYMLSAANKMNSQYFVLRQNSEEGNAEGLIVLFSNAVLRILRTYIFSELSYVPNYLSAFNLWMLCLYASPNMGKLEYLFEKLRGETFFRNIDYDSKFHHRIMRIPDEKLVIMDEILNVLIHKLKNSTQKP